MWTRRALLAGLAGLALTGPALAQRGGVPPAVADALSRHPKYRGVRIRSVRQRRPAPTRDGWMYEAVVEARDGRRYLVYVDPATARVLYDTEPR